MSSLWTPSGEHPLDRPTPGGEPPSSGPAREGPAGPPPPEPGEADGAPSAEDLQRLQSELAATPPEVVVANHCYGLFELAAVYLSQQPDPMLERARLAIDALAALVEGLAGRLGDQEATLRDALAQVRLAYVQLGAAAGAPDPGT